MKTQLIDEALLGELFSLGLDLDQPLLADMIKNFKVDFANRLQQLRSFSRNHNFTELEDVAHSLKGSAGALGGLALRELCHALEMKAENHQTMDELEFTQLQQTFTQTTHLLDGFMIEVAGKIAA